jgi:predicted dehydrogenase
MVRWFVGPEAGDVRRIESLITRSRHRGPHDETAMVGLEFESGVTAQITTSVLYASATRFELYGSQDAAICESTFGPYGGGRIRTGAGDLGFSPLDPYIGEIDDFCLAIRDGRDPEVPGEVGTANVALLERIAPA